MWVVSPWSVVKGMGHGARGNTAGSGQQAAGSTSREDGVKRSEVSKQLTAGNRQQAGGIDDCGLGN